MISKITLIALIVVLAGGVVATIMFQDRLLPKAFAPTQTQLQEGITSISPQPMRTTNPFGGATPGPSIAATPQADVRIMAEGLEIPWEMAWLPDGSLLVTERPGRLLKISPQREVIEVEGVTHVGEGGLQGMAVDPNFLNNQFIYLYLTTEQEDGLINRVDRYKLTGTRLMEKATILDNIPGARFHDGGRIQFGPDGKLYITAGDASQENSAQDTSILSGSILRINADGTIPEDNPFGNAIFSYGHRNPQGIAWDSQGRLWATEHGRSGILSGLDEINLIEKGKNYGWPLVQGDETQEDMEPPKAHSGPDETWAPAGAVFIGEKLYFAGLRGEALYEAVIENDSVTSITAHLRGQFGRLRAVAIGPDGWLYITTSNRDGRGKINSGDDKIIRINPEIFQ